VCYFMYWKGIGLGRSRCGKANDLNEMDILGSLLGLEPLPASEWNAFSI
jgi:hypothetical protein